MNKKERKRIEKKLEKRRIIREKIYEELEKLTTLELEILKNNLK